MKVFLIGMPGSGKTSVGRRLAPLVGAHFVDADDEIESRAGRAIPQIFDSDGEGRFRRLEAGVIADLCRDPRDLVIATGGGAAMHPESRRLMRAAGRVVHLDVSPATAARRTRTPGRPLLDAAADRLAAVQALFAERTPVYRRCAHVTVGVEAEPAAAIAERLALELGEARIVVSLGSRSYPVHVGPGALATLGERLRARTPAARAVVVSDRNVADLYGPRARRALRRAGFRVDELVVPPGERSKSMRHLSRLYNGLAAAGADRQTPVVALGGGVIGDLAGLAAATWLRGVPLVQVPTTLLAQVDSAIGGKVAINHDSGKNRIGAFHQPLLVVADPELLATLPTREMRGGLGEVLKYGAAMDRALFRVMTDDADALLAGDQTRLGRVVLRCVSLKARVVARDEEDRKGIRAVLNAGHTIGHALEAATRFKKWKHGEAVAAGLVLESRLAAEEGVCTDSVVARVRAAVDRFRLPVEVSVPGAAAFLGSDKKREGARLTAPLLSAIGRTRLVELPVARWRTFVRRAVERA